jgi:cytochrome c biogenesis protein CcdA/thiol-disulfide isomerase/thioredoxin
MFLLIGVGFLAGLVTGISPCIVPVLPVIVAAGATGSDAGWRRPFLVVGGLVISFTAVTLVGLEVLNLLHLPDDLLRWAGIALLLILGVGLVIPYVGALVERPFARLRLGAPKARSNGLLLGVSLGFVFVPCAGPVLATITTVATAHRVGPTLIFMTLAYAIGASVPLLALAFASSKATGTVRALKSHIQAVRQWSGVLIVASGIALWTGLFNPLQTAVPGYTNALQTRIESSSSVASRLAALKGEKGPKKLGRLSPTVGADLMDYGGAPPFTGITEWLNTPGDRPLTLQSLRGKVVLVDFWTYSCINCERSLPHVEAWYKAYEKDGFVVVGVHTPEFAFEHVPSNVAAAAKNLGVQYPIAIDNNYGTWNAYQNQYWPA